VCGASAVLTEEARDLHGVDRRSFGARLDHERQVVVGEALQQAVRDAGLVDFVGDAIGLRFELVVDRHALEGRTAQVGLRQAPLHFAHVQLGGRRGVAFREDADGACRRLVADVGGQAQDLPALLVGGRRQQNVLDAQREAPQLQERREESAQ